MQVLDSATGKAIALGELKPNLCPPLREIKAFSAISYTETVATDVGSAWVVDFGQNMGGMITLTLPPNHQIPKGTVLRIEHGEVIQGTDIDIEGMCKLCPKCGSCSAANPAGGSCDMDGPGAVCNTYCRARRSGSDALDGYSNALRHEPCSPHQSYTPGFPVGGIKAHDTPDRYVLCFFFLYEDGLGARYDGHAPAQRYSSLSGV
jgi:hypothetical protein